MDRPDAHPARNIARVSHFQPTIPDRPCWQCSAFDGVDSSGTAALCHRRRYPRVRTQPERGCSGWQREVGADDEPERVLIRLARMGAAAKGNPVGGTGPGAAR